ncbi:MAG: alpha/beta fold hydrolase [Eubacterium sp.]|nr:alpha/beta fold hydrolase [Eubacterium sp.]
MMKQVCFNNRGETVFGYAHLPAGSAPAPALILCHGFTGACHEGSRLYVDFAKEASAHGFYVLRFDFIGSGSSEADFAENTHLSGWVSDLLAAVTFVQNQPEVDPERIGMLGISFGGGTVLTAGIDERIKAVAAWAPVVNGEEVFRGIFTDEKWDALEKGTVKRIDHQYEGAYFSVTDQFVKDIRAINIAGNVCNYRNTALLLAQGASDAFINPERTKELAESVSFPVEFHLIEGEEHSFMVHESENIDMTVSFFERVFKL